MSILSISSIENSSEDSLFLSTTMFSKKGKSKNKEKLDKKLEEQFLKIKDEYSSSQKDNRSLNIIIESTAAIKDAIPIIQKDQLDNAAGFDTKGAYERIESSDNEIDPLFSFYDNESIEGSNNKDKKNQISSNNLDKNQKNGVNGLNNVDKIGNKIFPNNGLKELEELNKGNGQNLNQNKAEKQQNNVLFESGNKLAGNSENKNFDDLFNIPNFDKNGLEKTNINNNKLNSAQIEAPFEKGNRIEGELNNGNFDKILNEPNSEKKDVSFEKDQNNDKIIGKQELLLLPSNEKNLDIRPINSLDKKNSNLEKQAVLNSINNNNQITSKNDDLLTNIQINKKSQQVSKNIDKAVRNIIPNLKAPESIEEQLEYLNKLNSPKSKTLENFEEQTNNSLKSIDQNNLNKNQKDIISSNLKDDVIFDSKQQSAEILKENKEQNISQSDNSIKTISVENKNKIELNNKNINNGEGEQVVSFEGLVEPKPKNLEKAIFINDEETPNLPILSSKNIFGKEDKETVDQNVFLDDSLKPEQQIMENTVNDPDNTGMVMLKNPSGENIGEEKIKEAGNVGLGSVNEKNRRIDFSKIGFFFDNNSGQLRSNDQKLRFRRNVWNEDNQPTKPSILSLNFRSAMPIRSKISAFDKIEKEHPLLQEQEQKAKIVIDRKTQEIEMDKSINQSSLSLENKDDDILKRHEAVLLDRQMSFLGNLMN